MRLTAKQSSRRTLTDLCRSVERQQAVTITYQDETGELTVRTVEPFDVRTTKNGRIELRAMCRLRGDARAFAVHRIISYTCHRMGFVLERPEATTPAGYAIVARSEQQLIARELGRDYLPTRRLVRTDVAPAA